MENQKITPDAETLERIENLAIVGTVIRQSYGEDNQDVGSKYFLARESLKKFHDGIKKLNLDPTTELGMDRLVSYLGIKLDKREKGNFS